MRDFISGGLFSNGDTRIGDKTSSNGFSPRVIATWEPNRNLSVNVQAAKGFRLGGVNDPLNLPLCSDAGRGHLRAVRRRIRRRNAVELRSRRQIFEGPRSPSTRAVFHTKIKDLQVTLDAGSCSSRIVFNVPKAHTTGVEVEFAVIAAPGLDLSLAGSYVSAEFDSTLSPSVLASHRPASAKATACRPCRSSRWRPRPPTGSGSTTMATGMSTPATSMSAAAYTQPADQENNPRTFFHGNTSGGIRHAGAGTLGSISKLPIL